MNILFISLPRVKWLFNNKFFLMVMLGLFFIFIDRVIRLAIPEINLKYYLLSLFYVFYFILFYLITRTSNKEDVSSSNHCFREKLAEVQSVFENIHFVNIHNLLQQNRTNLSVFVHRLSEYRQTLLEKEKNLSLQQIFPERSSPYKVAWNHWRGILKCGISSFIFLMLSLAKIFLASRFLGYIYFTCIFIFFSTPILKKYRNVFVLNWIYSLVKMPFLSKLILIGLLLGLLVYHFTLKELQQSYLYEAILIGMLAPVYLLVAVKSFSTIDTAIQGIEEGELLVAKNLKEHGYHYECNINYPKKYLQINSLAIHFFKKLITSNNSLSHFISNRLEYLFYQGDIDTFIPRFLLNSKITVVFECKSTSDEIKVKNFQDPRKNSVLGRVKEKGNGRRTIEPLNKAKPPEQLIQEKADWLQIERKLLNRPIPALVFTQATLRLSEQYLVDGFYCFNGVWVVSYNQLNDFLNYLERQAAVL